MKGNTIITALFLLIILSGIAYADNFDIIGSDVAGYDCVEQQISSLFILNKGTSPSSYAISLKGTASDYITYSPISFILQPGQKQEIKGIMRVPCGKSGEFDLNVYAQDSFGEKKAIKEKIVIIKQQNIQITPIEHSKQISPCTTASYRFNITNTGTFTEDYSVVFGREFGPYINVTFNEIALQPGEQKELAFYVTPSCEIYGDYEIPFKVQTLNTKLIAKTSAFISIRKEYDYALSIGEEGYYSKNKTIDFVEQDEDAIYELCADGKISIPINLDNQANLQNTYELSLKSPKWISLSDSNVKVDGFKNKITEILIGTSNKKGDYIIDIASIGKYGGIKQNKKINIAIDNCYKTEAKYSSEKEAEVVSYETLKLPVNLYNTGLKDAKYSLSIENPGWVTVAPTSISVGANSTSKIDILSKPTAEENKRGTYDITLVVKVDGTNIEYKHNFKVKLVTMNFFDRTYYNFIIPYRWYLSVSLILLAALIALGVYYYKKHPKKKKKEAVKEQKAEKKKLSRAKQIILASLIGLMFIAAVVGAYFIIPKKIIQDYKWYFLFGLIGLVALILAALIIVLVKKKKLRFEIQSEKKEKKRVSINLLSKKYVFIILGLIVLVAVAFGVYHYFSYIKDFSLMIFRAVKGFLFSYWIYIAYVAAALLLLTLLILLIYYYKKRNVVNIELKELQTNVTLNNKRIPIGEMIINLNDVYHESGFKIKKISKPTFIAAGEEVYRYLNFQTRNLEPNDISEIIVRFKVKKSWLKRKNIDKINISLRRYHNKWLGINTKIISDDNKYCYYESAITHLTYFAIVGTPTKPKIYREENVIFTKEEPFDKKEVHLIQKVEKKILQKKTKINFKLIGMILLWIALAAILLGAAYSVYHFINQIIGFILLYKYYLLSGIGILIFVAVIGLVFIKNKYRFNFKKIKIKKPQKETLLRILKIIAIIVLLALIILGLYSYNGYLKQKESYNQTQDNLTKEQEEAYAEEIIAGMPHQTWDEDTQITLNLTEYFSDPDNDTLYYSNTELRHIKAEYNNEFVVLVPERNWYGSEYVIFTADDRKGGRTDSNIVRLTVEDVPEQNIFDQAWDFITK